MNKLILVLMVIFFAGCSGQNIGSLRKTDTGYQVTTWPNNGPFGASRLAIGDLYLYGDGPIFGPDKISTSINSVEKPFEYGYVVVGEDLKWFEIRLMVESIGYPYNGWYKNSRSSD